jgi:hypothetical protein
MQEALKNPHYKKIWEKVIMNNNPTAKTLDEALEREFFNFGNTDAGNLCRVYVNFKGDFINGQGIGIACGASKPCNYDTVYKEVFVKEYWGNMKLYLTDKIKQNHGKVIDFQILGRPITLFDVLKLLQKNIENGEFALMTNCVVLCNIDVTRNTSNDTFQYFVKKICDINNKSNLIEEQTPETWEKIANLIDLCKI